MKRALQVEGVRSVEVDFEKKTATLRVDAKKILTPSDLQKLLPRRFKLGVPDYENLEGVPFVDQNDRRWLQAGEKVFELREGKEEAWRKLGELLGSPKVRVSGEVREEKRREGEKERVVLVLTVSAAEAVRENGD